MCLTLGLPTDSCPHCRRLRRGNALQRQARDAGAGGQLEVAEEINSTRAASFPSRPAREIVRFRGTSMALPPQNQNPYAPSPACAAASGSLPDTQPLSREEIEAFAGRNGRVYWDFLQSARHSPTLFAGFNFAAAAFSFFWLLYRKMYWESVVIFFLTMPIGVAFLHRSTHPMSGALLSLTPLSIMAAVGILGNGLYFRRVRMAVAEVRQQESNPAKRLALLSARGGTSWLAPVAYT